MKMTKLTYKVNGVEYSSYSKAIAATECGRHRLHSIYTPMPEIGQNVDPEKRAKRIAAIQAKARKAKEEKKNI